MEEERFYSSAYFQNYFKAGCSSLVLKANPPLFTVLAVSDKYLLLVGKSRDEVLHFDLFDVFPGSATDPSGQHSVINSFHRVIKNRQTDELPLIKYEIFTNEGQSWETEYWTNVNDPVLDKNGDVAFLVNTTTNITEQVYSRHVLEEAKNIKASFEELTLSKQAARLGTFSFELRQNSFSCDDRCRELFGIAHHDSITFETDFVGRLHSDDRERMVAVINHLLSDDSMTDDYDVEFRTVGAADGRVRWVRAKGKVYFDPGNRPDRFMGMVLDITEQKLDDQRKNDFIGMVSHEMKTPLTSLSGYLQMMKLQTSREDKFINSMLQKADKQVNRIITLINGFLNVSRLESGKIHIDKQRFDMAKLMEEAKEEVSSLINSHRIAFAPVAPMYVYADRDKIQQVISNLISNAAKYSPVNSLISVACYADGGWLTVSMKDEGIGIKEEDQSKLFDRFYRAHENKSMASGFGIGLYLCSEIIQRHEGRIWVDSEVGKGSTFSFSLPVVA